jgi:carboxypeptidase Taq
MDNNKLEKLKSRLARVADLVAASLILEWDQETYMPSGGVEARADQISTLHGLAHNYFVDKEIGALLEDLSNGLDSHDYFSDEASIIRVAMREYEKLVKVPTILVEEINKTKSLSMHAWQESRRENNFATFQPWLEKTVVLQQTFAACFKPTENLYDALIDYYEPGITYDQISVIFNELKPRIVELVKAITEHTSAVDDSFLHKDYPPDVQMAFGKSVAEHLGFSFKRGRMDLSTHPFSIAPARDDSRITTRIVEDYLPKALMSIMHETGHSLYEMGISPSLYRIGLGGEARLGEGASMSVHESQARFYENVIGRSRPFWKYFFPKIQQAFPEQLNGVGMETFYRAINKSEPSLIRVKADEVTYGLHIILRFELENDLINGHVQVKDLPDIWNDRMELYLGIRPPDDSLGVMQDIQWSAGLFGYFPDYLLGSILAVQWWEKMIGDHPEIPSEIETGEFGTILTWLGGHVHQHGKKFTLNELTERALGSPLNWEPYLAYLKTKYGEIYEL